MSLGKYPACVLIRCVRLRDPQQLFVLQGLAGAADDDLAGTFKDDLTLTVRDGSPMKLSPAQVKQMSREDLVKVWKVKTGLHSPHARTLAVRQQ